MSSICTKHDTIFRPEIAKFNRNRQLIIYCWWFRTPVNSPVEVGSLSHYLQGFIHPNGGFLAGFRTNHPTSTSLHPRHLHRRHCFLDAQNRGRRGITESEGGLGPRLGGESTSLQLLNQRTPWKINMKPTNHRFGKENDLPNLHDYVPC